MSENRLTAAEAGLPDFDNLRPVEIHFTYRGAGYILCEADEEAAVEWKNSNLRTARISDGRVTSFGNIADSEPLLVSLCLYRAGKDDQVVLDKDGRRDKQTRVPLSTLKTWPAKVVGPLFTKAKEISDLNEEESKEVLEKRFEDTCVKLVGLSEGNEDRLLWKEWMHSLVDEKIQETPDGGPVEEHRKNGRVGGRPTTATPRS